MSGPDTTRSKVNVPEVYYGDHAKLKSFLTQSASYIFWNSKEFDSEVKEVVFMTSYMRGRAYEWIQPRLQQFLEEQGEAPLAIQRLFFQKNAFLTELKQLFGNVDEVRTAEKGLRSLRQVGSAGTYSAEFRRLAATLG